MYTSRLANTELSAQFIELLGPLAAPAGLADCLAHSLLSDSEGGEPRLDDVAEAASLLNSVSYSLQSFFVCHLKNMLGIGFEKSQSAEGVPEIFSSSRSGGCRSSKKERGEPDGVPSSLQKNAPLKSVILDAVTNGEQPGSSRS